jgi:GntR family transcriptional regulator of arabinose operon
MNTKSQIPLYSQIRQYIVDRMVDGTWVPHHQIPPERELAEQFSVSRITAKNAVLQLVNEGLLYRHRGKGTFVSDSSNELLSSSSSHKGPTQSKSKVSKKLIGFVIPWIELHYTSLLFGGLEASLSKQGYHVIFRRISTPDEEREAIRLLLELPVDGIVIATSRGEHFDNGLVRLVLDKFPLVLIEKTMRDVKVNGVFCDTEKAGELMARYLIQQSVQRIGLVSYPDSFTYGVRERLFGFQSELLRGGISPLPSQRILTLPAELLGTAGQMGGAVQVPDDIYRFLDANPDLQAIATADAWLARLVGQACRQRGLEEMLIVGFDEPSAYPDAVSPSAYIDQSPFEMGAKAAELIVDAIERRTAERQIAIEPKLVELKKHPQSH